MKCPRVNNKIVFDNMHFLHIPTLEPEPWDQVTCSPHFWYKVLCQCKRLFRFCPYFKAQLVKDKRIVWVSVILERNHRKGKIQTANHIKFLLFSHISTIPNNLWKKRNVSNQTNCTAHYQKHTNKTSGLCQNRAEIIIMDLTHTFPFQEEIPAGDIKQDDAVPASWREEESNKNNPEDEDCKTHKTSQVRQRLVFPVSLVINYRASYTALKLIIRCIFTVDKVLVMSIFFYNCWYFCFKLPFA